jgi:MFS transporter, MFS domain-containing protein family, molybdate-anion transporter
MLDTYQLNLAGLLCVCSLLFASQTKDGEKNSSTAKADAKDGAKTRQYERRYQGSQWAFYVVYALVMGADWLQVRRTLIYFIFRLLLPNPGNMPAKLSARW